MIHFITPLAAKASVGDWGLTCSLLRQTLSSLENQTHPEFVSTVCCHDVPDFAGSLDSRFTFVECPYAPPQNSRTVTGSNSGLVDMMTKRDVALFHAQPQADDFVVVLDADDLFSNTLTSHIISNAHADGVTFEWGYELCHVTKRLLPRKDMVNRTSSSFALSGSLLKAPPSIEREDLAKTLFHSVWHSNVKAYLESTSANHVKLNEYLVIYRTNTGLNMSDYYRVNPLRYVRHRLKFLLGRRITASDWVEFRLNR